MIDVNAPSVFGRRKAGTRKASKPGAWAMALFLGWLALLAVPIVGLYNLDAFAPPGAEVQPKPWMPIHPPII